MHIYAAALLASAAALARHPTESCGAAQVPAQRRGPTPRSKGRRPPRLKGRRDAPAIKDITKKGWRARAARRDVDRGNYAVVWGLPALTQREK